MSFSKINAWLHLWLGLASGLVVVVVGFTGCVLVFKEDIEAMMHPYRHAEVPAGSTYLAPSVLVAAAEKEMAGMKAHSIYYNGRTKAAEVNFRSDSTLYINPNTANVTGIATRNAFFRQMEVGHTSLWLPPKIGHAVVSYGTLIFAILLITGIVLWWPKKWNKREMKNAFTILWKGKWKRVNYDLHNVLGFYALIVCLVIALSGIFMSLSWFQKSMYWMVSGGKAMPVYYEPTSDTTLVAKGAPVLDEVWSKIINEYADNKSEVMILGIPDESSEAIYAYANTEGARYRALYFDQVSGAFLKGTGTDVDRFSEANAGDQLRRLNYSLHVGSLWGLPSKFIYFIASLIAASLPVTGFYIWWGKKRKKKKTVKRVLPEHVSSLN